jgi:hypothetical protein
MTDRHLSNVEAEIERWVNRRNAGNNAPVKEENEQEIDIKKESHHRGEVTQEEEEAEEDFMADDDMDANVVIGEEEPKEGLTTEEGFQGVEYASGDEGAMAR